MKKSLVARGFIGAVASLLGVVAVGCSAEGYDDGQVASQSQNLANAAPVATDIGAVDSDSGQANTQLFDLFKAASCKLLKDDHYVMLIAGGFNLAGTAQSAIYEYDPSVGTNGTFTKLTPTLQTARGGLRGIPVPGASNKCMFAGGYTTGNFGTASNKVDIVDYTSSTYNRTNGTSMNTARGDFALLTCGTSDDKLIAIGGFDNAAGTKELTNIEYSSNNVAGAAWTNTTGLSTAVYSLAAAKKPGAEKYVVAGGITTGGSSVDKITQIVASNCSTAGGVTQLGVTKVLANASEGLVGFYEGTTDTFLFGGGRTTTTSGALTDMNKIVANWTTPTSTTISAGTALTTGAYRPAIVQSFSGSNPANMLIGGSDGDEGSAGANLDTILTSAVEQYQKVYGKHVVSLPASTSAVDAVAEELDGAVYFVTGRQIAGGTASAQTHLVVINP